MTNIMVLVIEKLLSKKINSETNFVNIVIHSSIEASHVSIIRGVFNRAIFYSSKHFL